MKILFSVPLLILGVCLTISHAAKAEQNTMKCETGPAKKHYGNASWLVYSCTDNTTLLIVSDTGNPAMPFYFRYYLKNGVYTLTGEGSGSKQASDAAYKDLIKLHDTDIRKIIAETKRGN